MALTKLTDNLNIIDALSRFPNQSDGLDSDQLQQKFDEAGNLIKTYINDTLTAEIDTTDSANVKLTGNQTVAGVKTFSSSPIVPDPTTSTQATSKNYVDTDSPTVKLTGNQTVAGIKTFTSFPITPTASPTTDYQASNKKYVDDEIAGVVAGDFPDYYNNKISFDSLLTNSRYRVTEFDTPTAGSITETIKLVSDDSTYATRVTTFDTPVAGAITETIVCSALSVNNAFITEFDTPTSSDITETGGAV